MSLNSSKQLGALGMDDFEMRPITEGLGFNRKKNNDLRDSTDESKLIDDIINQSLPTPPPDDLLDREVKRSTSTLDELMASLSEDPSSLKPQKTKDQDVKIQEPLPRSHGVMQSIEVELPPSKMPAPTIDEGFVEEKSPAKPPVPRINEGVQRSGHNSPRTVSLQPTTVSLSSSILDGVIVLGLSLLFLLALLMVTKVDLALIMESAKHDLTVQLSLGLLYVAVLQMYVVISRSFFGRTLAEWTFDLQLGDEKQIQRASYPFLVLWRSLIIMATGLVVIPTLSFITRVDLASYLSGLQIYKKKMV